MIPKWNKKRSKETLTFDDDTSMNEKEYSIEYVLQVWNDKTGERLEVSPDRDGLGLVEIRSVTDDEKVGARIIGTVKCMMALHEALGKYLSTLQSKTLTD